MVKIARGPRRRTAAPAKAGEGARRPAKAGVAGRGKVPSPQVQLAAVRQRLQEYADRGVFRGYTERPARAGRHYFRFLWLAREPFTLTYEPSSGTFTFINVLPHVPVRSALYADLAQFIEGRASTRLPAHRRIDPRRARASCAGRRGTMLISVVAKPRHHAYALTRAVNLVHEVFLHLHSYFPEYLWEHYHVAQE